MSAPTVGGVSAGNRNGGSISKGMRGQWSNDKGRQENELKPLALSFACEKVRLTSGS